MRNQLVGLLFISRCWKIDNSSDQESATKQGVRKTWLGHGMFTQTYTSEFMPRSGKAKELQWRNSFCLCGTHSFETVIHMTIWHQFEHMQSIAGSISQNERDIYRGWVYTEIWPRMMEVIFLDSNCLHAFLFFNIREASFFVPNF
jgi:hypothetical protein